MSPVWIRWLAVVALMLASGSPRAEDAPATLLDATAESEPDRLSFDLRVDGTVNREQVLLTQEQEGTVLSIRLRGAEVERRFIELGVPQVQRALLHPSKEPAGYGVLRVRFRAGVSETRVDAARIESTRGHVRVAIPATDKLAAAWLAPPPPPPPVVTVVPVAPPPPTAPPTRPPAPVTAPPTTPPTAPPTAAPTAPPTAAPSAAAPASAPASAPGSRPAEDETFVEGELANVGATSVAPWHNRIGVALGIERVGEIYYGAATPQANHSTRVDGRPLSLSFGVPLRFEIVDARPNERFDHAGQIRKEDWDRPGDYTRLIQRITYGGKEKHTYLNIDSGSTTTLGHGALMRRYNPHLDLNANHVSAELDAFDDFGGGEFYLDDIAGPNIVGGLVFLKPLSAIDRSNSMLRSISLGFTLVADLDAPARMGLDFDDVDDDGRRESELEIDQETFEPTALETTALGWGADLEIKLVDRRILDWKAYVDWSFLTAGLPVERSLDIDAARVETKEASAEGFTFGHLFRLNLGQAPVHALRIRVEYRNTAPNYQPGYFDLLYAVQRVHATGPVAEANSADALANGTRLQRILGRDADGDRVHGGYLEASWRMADHLALALGLEVNSRTPDDSLFLHVEVPHLGDWQFLTTYHHRQQASLADALTPTLGDTDFLVVTTRYAVWNWLHLRVDAATPFGIGPDSLFRSKLQTNLGVDLGWSY